MQTVRRAIQAAAVALTLGAVFLLGANAERWCPFGGVESLYTYAREGNMPCSLGTSNFCILGGVIVMTLLVRRAFCSYLCPLGALSEWLRALGRKLRLPALRAPRGADRVLSLGKYAVLGLVLYLTWRAGELLFRGFDPCYALISRHGTDITFWAYGVSGTLAAASLFVMLPLCRWLCPFAAVLHLFSRPGLMRIKRTEALCTDCRRCSRACPMAIPVHELAQVTAPRCTSCMNCVDACPHRNPSALVWGLPGRSTRHWPQAALVAVLLACTGGAVAVDYAFPVPSFSASRGEPPAMAATVRLGVRGLDCRGRGNMLFHLFLDRDDVYALSGYLKADAWPGPGYARLDVTYDPSRANEEAVKLAITEPYYDAGQDRWRMSPFAVEGYDPLGVDDLAAPGSGPP